MGNVLRSLAFYAAFYGLSIVWVIVALCAVPFGAEPVRKVADSWSALHRACARWLLGIEIREEGQRPSGVVLYAFKHESFFEAIDIAATLTRPVIFAKQELFSIPGWGRVARTYGAVPVARSDGAKALRTMISEARSYASSGRPLVIFPEGTRTPHGQQPPLRSGFAGLYKALALPVVPVALDSGPLYQRVWKKSGMVTLRFSEPIPPGLPRAEVEARVHAAINALNGV
jgi:1-acyl-sn-glycerol-3-phosphate acyltransferase